MENGSVGHYTIFFYGETFFCLNPISTKCISMENGSVGHYTKKYVKKESKHNVLITNFSLEETELILLETTQSLSVSPSAMHFSSTENK